MFKVLLFCCFLSIFASVDNSLMSNIQKLFSEKIEIFSAVEFSKVSVLTGIVKISLKVRIFFLFLFITLDTGEKSIFFGFQIHNKRKKIFLRYFLVHIRIMFLFASLYIISQDGFNINHMVISGRFLLPWNFFIPYP